MVWWTLGALQERAQGGAVVAGRPRRRWPVRVPIAAIAAIHGVGQFLLQVQLAGELALAEPGGCGRLHNAGVTTPLYQCLLDNYPSFDPCGLQIHRFAAACHTLRISGEDCKQASEVLVASVSEQAQGERQ